MKKLLVKFLILEIAFLIAAFFVRSYWGKDIFLADSANFGWVFGIIGTAYTLIAAFVLFGVWNQYNALSVLMARESWLLSSLWNVTDYFNDEKLSQLMQKALLAYLAKTVDEEIGLLAREQEVQTYSREYTNIGSVIDGIVFNDERDGAIYPLIIQGYRDLLDVRQQRNEAGVTRLTISMKSLFVVFSLLLALSAVIAGFANTGMYLTGVGFIGAIVILTYLVVADMDNPFGGLFAMEPHSFQQAQDYIERTGHRV